MSISPFYYTDVGWKRPILSDIPIGKYLIGRTPFFEEEKFSFFKVTENGPRIIKLLAINHRIYYSRDQEH